MVLGKRERVVGGGRRREEGGEIATWQKGSGWVAFCLLKAPTTTTQPVLPCQTNPVL